MQGSPLGGRASASGESVTLSSADTVVASVAAFNAQNFVAVACIGLGILFINTNASNAQWVAVCDKNAAPVNGDAILYRVRVNATSVFYLDLSSRPPFVAGIAIAETSTTGTVTLTGGSDMHATVIARAAP